MLGVLACFWCTPLNFTDIPLPPSRLKSPFDSTRLFAARLDCPLFDPTRYVVRLRLCSQIDPTPFAARHRLCSSLDSILFAVRLDCSLLDADSARRSTRYCRCSTQLCSLLDFESARHPIST
uniref:Secreted protein n=1 Tax=Plectus sambesii TaxID=2011161 RepID=A0A914WJY8_9BILA